VISAIGVFASIFVLLVLVDYIEMVRKTSGLVSAPPIMVAETSLFRVPQLLEKMMPFCVLIGAMTCYLALSRRLELVVARAAGVSAWQFIAPALAAAMVMGVLATVAYNPMSANLRELSKQMEAQLFGGAPGGGVQDASGFWINQINADGQVIMNAARSEHQGVRLTGLTLFRFDTNNVFKERIEAREATLELCARCSPGRSGQLQASDVADTCAGAQQFFDPRNCVLLATSRIHPLVGKFGICDRRISPAVP
jgi:lipopolysaccharide export system permease protein